MVAKGKIPFFFMAEYSCVCEKDTCFAWSYSVSPTSFILEIIFSPRSLLGVLGIFGFSKVELINLFFMASTSCGCTTPYINVLITFLNSLVNPFGFFYINLFLYMAYFWILSANTILLIRVLEYALVHVLLKPCLENFEHYFTSMR